MWFGAVIVEFSRLMAGIFQETMVTQAFYLAIRFLP
jgi:hypothetical protein